MLEIVVPAGCAGAGFGLGGEEGPLPDELPGGGVGLELAAGVGAAEP